MSAKHRTHAQQELKALVAAKTWTPTTIARALGVAQPSVTAWIQGQSRPEAHLREAIERLVGIEASAWMTDAEYRVAFGKARAA